jgi:hypothetical protein
MASLLQQLAAQQPSRGTQPTETAKEKEVPILLSAFEVTTTAGSGYVSTNNASALKTSEEMMKIPQAVTVLDRRVLGGSWR